MCLGSELPDIIPQVLNGITNQWGKKDAYGGKHLVAITQKFVDFTMQFNCFFFWGGGVGGSKNENIFCP